MLFRSERRAHRDALVRHFEQNLELLDEDARRRLHTNPLRILDSKNPSMQPVIEAAPKLIDFLGAQSQAHFDGLRRLLDAAGLAYRINPRLVRGMDYYNLTVFEWVTDHLGSQGTICGGGRYDGLIEQMGGKPAPAIGFGLGIERLLLLVQELQLEQPDASPGAYAIVAEGGDLAAAMTVIEQLRAQGVGVLLHSGSASHKSQMKKADASGAKWALVFDAGQLTVKPLRDREAQPLALPLGEGAAAAALAALQSHA